MANGLAFIEHLSCLLTTIVIFNHIHTLVAESSIQDATCLSGAVTIHKIHSHTLGYAFNLGYSILPTETLTLEGGVWGACNGVPVSTKWCNLYWNITEGPNLMWGPRI